MSEDKKSLIDLVPDSVDNAVKNITDKPTQTMGTTLADIWYLVFGGISQAAEKRKLKYSYALQEFEKELKEKISKIPEDKLVEPDIQVVAPVLEAAKYCIEKEELRLLFSKLISSSMNEDYYKCVHPTFTNIIKQLSEIDAILLNAFFQNIGHVITLNINENDLLFSLSFLESIGLVYTDIKDSVFEYAIKDDLDPSSCFDERNFHLKARAHDSKKIIHIHITDLGMSFCNICIQ